VTAALVPFLRTRNRSSLAHTRSAECWQQFALCRSSTACRPVSLGVRSDHADTIVPSGFHLGSPRTGRVVSALVFGGAVGGGAAKGGRDHEDGHSRDGHSRLIPAMAGKGRCANRQAGTLGPRQTYEFSCSVARGPQPARGGRRCQDPLECPTLATLADALEASNLGCRPGWAAIAGCRRFRLSVRG
jgi:hypothetical protein